MQVLGEHVQPTFSSESVREAISSAWKTTHDTLNRWKQSGVMLKEESPALYTMVFGTAIAAGGMSKGGNSRGHSGAVGSRGPQGRTQESEEKKVLISLQDVCLCA